MIRTLILAILSVIFIIQPVFGEKENPIEKLRLKLDALVPGMSPNSIKPTPVKGLYEVVYGAQVMYLSEDGRYMFRGNLIDLDQREDLTEKTQSKARKLALSEVSEDEMIVFLPKTKETRHIVTIFTDIDCPYCRKLHAEMDEYSKAGIKVRYLMFPRMGIDSPAYKKAVSVWCANDKNQALTEAKQGKSVPSKSCNNPIQSQMELGQMIGVSGTPAIVLENGDLVPGYRPASELAYILERMDVIQ